MVKFTTQTQFRETGWNPSTTICRWRRKAFSV